MEKVQVAQNRLEAGGGDFALPRVTLGVFLNAQPQHRIGLGGDRRTLRPLERHQGWILPAGSEGICEYDESLEFLTVSVEHSMLRDAGFEAQSNFAPIIGDIDPLLLSLALNSHGFVSAGRLYRDTMERALAAQLAQVILPTDDRRSGIEDVRLRRALDYIHGSLEADLSLDQMAQEAAMSTSRFSKAFKAATGKSPLQYVIDERLELASALLKTTSLPVAEVAFRCCYNDLSRFGQHFKRKFGVTPGEFRAA